jgi:lysophospholipase L1-like esterase
MDSVGISALATTEIPFILPKKVVLFTGINDAMNVSLANYQSNVNAFIAAAQAAGSKVYIVVVPQGPPGSWGGANEIIAQNAWLLTLTNVTLIRLDIAMSSDGSGTNVNSSWTLDGTHPNVTGAIRIANRFLIDAPDLFD